VEVYTTEEQQVEVIKSWWKENGTSVLAGTVIGLVGLFGWRYYNDYAAHQPGSRLSGLQRDDSAQLAKGDAATFEQVQELHH
jgi:predicted negative regulator of RcsB-dependent stress response